METLDETLISILARSDAVLRPWRDLTPAYGAVCVRRREWPDCGVEWRGGGGAADRKAAQRAAVDLQRQGLLKLMKRTGDRASSVRPHPRIR